MAGEINTQTVLTNLLPDLHATSFASMNFWTESSLIQWTDQAVKRLAVAAMVWIARDSSIETVIGTAIYALADDAIETVHISLATTPLRAAAVMDLEARDESFQSTAGTPDHWYEDDLMLGTVGLCPVPVAAAAVNTINKVDPPDVDVALVNTLVQAPAPLAIYLEYSVLAVAYGQEGEGEEPDLAKHCQGRADMLEQLFQQYYGKT